MILFYKVMISYVMLTIRQWIYPACEVLYYYMKFALAVQVQEYSVTYFDGNRLGFCDYTTHKYS